MTGRPIELVQSAPGRYEATFEAADASGNYFVNLGYRGAGGVQGVISSGVSVPYSDEYRELRSNPASLETVATLTNGSTTFFKKTPDGRPDAGRTVREVDHFRRDAGLVNPKSYADLWPSLLWLATVLFLGDVAVRRVAPDVDRARKYVSDRWRTFRGREVVPSSQYMEKLRSRKAEVSEKIDRARASSRFEIPDAPPTSPPAELTSGAGTGPARAEGPRKPAAEGPGLGPDAPKAGEPESYTNRLLKAKQKVWEEREKDKDKDRGKPS